jgi:hypothetical protein
MINIAFPWVIVLLYSVWICSVVTSSQVVLNVSNPVDGFISTCLNIGDDCNLRSAFEYLQNNYNNGSIIFSVDSIEMNLALYGSINMKSNLDVKVIGPVVIRPVDELSTAVNRYAFTNASLFHSMANTSLIISLQDVIITDFNSTSDGSVFKRDSVEIDNFDIDLDDNHNILQFLVKNTSIKNIQSGGNGGAFFINKCANCVIENSVFLNISAYNSGGAIVLHTDITNFYIVNVTFIECRTMTGSGGAIFANSMLQNLTVSGSSFVQCHAGNSSYLSFKPSDVISTADSFGRKYAERTSALQDQSGGAIFILRDSSHVLIAKTYFIDCTAGVSGGALALYDGISSVSVVDSQFHNSSSTLGGSIYLYQKIRDIKISKTDFCNCNSLFIGGAIAMYQTGQIVIEYSSFNETESSYGGALHFYQKNNDIILRSCKFYKNSALVAGGAIMSYQYNSNFTLKDLSFDESKSAVTGGAIQFHMYQDSISIDNVTVIDAEAVDGAGIYIGDSNDVILRNIYFHTCTAISNGAGIYVSTLNFMVIKHIYMYSMLASNGAGIYSGEIFNSFDISNIKMYNMKVIGMGSGICINSLVKMFSLSSVYMNDMASDGRGGAIYIGANVFRANNYNNGVDIDKYNQVPRFSLLILLLTIHAVQKEVRYIWELNKRL